MRLNNLKISNFRAIRDVDVTFDNAVNVIVGPNAIGKSTILEAIRLVKAMLAPRTPNESNQALFSLGAASPHVPNRLRVEAVAQDPANPIVITCAFKFTDEETEFLKASTPQIARSLVQARMGQSFALPGALIAFLSSPAGKGALDAATQEIEKGWQEIDQLRGIVKLELTITPGVGPSSTGNQIGPILLATLEGRNAPNQTNFTYFPADRALPAGEQPVQLGSADSAQQLESHNSQPQLKYSRLKNNIFSAVIARDGSREELFSEVSLILSGLLKGRTIKKVGVNEIGLLSITVQDEMGREFDLDGMSSGEKGVILTFFTIERSVSNGGIVLLDEPELHLNPAVSKDLLPFIVDKYASRKGLQFILCSHSPEILAGAIDRDECSLYSLVSGTMLTKVRRQDHDVINDTLRELGTSPIEELLFRGIVFVEGVDDATILETAFGDVFRKLKIRDVGGRGSIERQIGVLQSLEAESSYSSRRFFIFDRDDAPTNLQSSKSIKILQWERRCLENYLIDLDIITNLLTNEEITKKPFKSLGEVTKFLKDLALMQIVEIAARKIYANYGFEGPSLRLSDVKGETLESISGNLWSRLTVIKKQVTNLSEEPWKGKFESDCQAEVKNLQSIWDIKWIEECDGKRLFADIGARGDLKMNVRNFKKRVANEMKNNQTENWKIVKSLLSDLTREEAPAANGGR